MEWYCISIPKDLKTNDDYDAIPESFKDSIKIRGTAVALIASFRVTEAQVHNQMFFTGELGVDRASAKRGAVQDYYWGIDLP